MGCVDVKPKGFILSSETHQKRMSKAKSTVKTKGAVSVPVMTIPVFDTRPTPIVPPVVTDEKVNVVQPIPDDLRNPKREILPEPKKQNPADIFKDIAAVDPNKKGAGGIWGDISPIVDVITLPLGPIGKVIKPIGDSASGTIDGITGGVGDVVGGVGGVISDVAGGVGDVAGRLLDIGDNFLDFLSNPLLTIGLIVVGGVVITRLIK